MVPEPDSAGASELAASEPRTPVPTPAEGRADAEERAVAELACRGSTWAGTAVGTGCGDEATRVDSARTIATRNRELLIVAGMCGCSFVEKGGEVKD